MVRNLLITLAALLILSAAGSALAISETDIDFLGVDELGYVGDGKSISYQHVFDPIHDPAKHVTSVESTWLYVGVMDDWVCGDLWGSMKDWFFEAEVAVLDLNSITWKSGSATARIFWGNVTAQANLLANDGILNVTVSSSQGDFTVLMSKMLTKYNWEPTGVNAIPEPSAALVFAFGMLVVTRGTKSSRR